MHVQQERHTRNKIPHSGRKYMLTGRQTTIRMWSISWDNEVLFVFFVKSQKPVFQQ